MLASNGDKIPPCGVPVAPVAVPTNRDAARVEQRDLACRDRAPPAVRSGEPSADVLPSPAVQRSLPVHQPPPGVLPQMAEGAGGYCMPKIVGPATDDLVDPDQRGYVTPTGCLNCGAVLPGRADQRYCGHPVSTRSPPAPHQPTNRTGGGTARRRHPACAHHLRVRHLRATPRRPAMVPRLPTTLPPTRHRRFLPPAVETPSSSPTLSRRPCPNLTTPDHVVTASHTTSVDSAPTRDPRSPRATAWPLTVARDRLRMPRMRDALPRRAMVPRLLTTSSAPWTRRKLPLLR